MHIIMFLFLVSLLSCQTKISPLKLDRISPAYWPTKNWQKTSPESQGMDSSKLTAMLRLIKEKNYRIDSVTVVRNNFIVTDAYQYPVKPEDQHQIYSVTKSILSSLIGIAIDKKFIENTNTPLLEFFKDRKILNVDEDKKAITLENLLTMSAGLKTEDSWRYKWKGMLKMKAQNDWLQYLLDLPMDTHPGKEFSYSNGSSYLISRILNKTTQMKPRLFAQKYLFSHLGINARDISWKLDKDDIQVGWAGMQMTPRDMAKFGVLFLNEGKWENKQLVSKEWIRTSTQTHIAADIYQNYGYQWWNGPAMFNMDKLWRWQWNWGFKNNYSQDYYMAVGFRGQYIFIAPAYNLVAVFTSNLTDKKHFFIPKALVDEYIIPSVTEHRKIPDNATAITALEQAVNELKSTRDFIWKSAEEGVVINNTFTRAKNPSFRLNLPPASRKADLLADDEIMAMTSKNGARYSISISDKSDNIPLMNIGDSCKKFLTDVGGTKVNTISNQQIVLPNKITAYKTLIRWNYGGTNLESAFISVYQEDKWILLSYSYDISNPKLINGAAENLDTLIKNWNI